MVAAQLHAQADGRAPCSRAMIGLMMLLVNETISPLNASAITSPTATTITSPRIMKFLKPLIGHLSD